MKMSFVNFLWLSMLMFSHIFFFLNNQYVFIKTLDQDLDKSFSLRIGNEELGTMHSSNNFGDK